MIEVMVAPENMREEIWRLFLEYAQELSGYDGERRPQSRKHYPYFDEYWDDDHRTPFVILYDHEPIGFCLLQQTSVNYQIDEFYIHPLHRQRGFGRTAVEFIKDHCRRLGKHTTIAANIYVNNEPAKRFWQSLGFQDTGRRVRIKNLRLIETEAELTPVAV